jgi:hypothetical protein
VHADTSEIVKALKPRKGQGGTYYRLEFEMVMSFGLTELKAQIAWLENVSMHASSSAPNLDKSSPCRTSRKGT